MASRRLLLLLMAVCAAAWTVPAGPASRGSLAWHLPPRRLRSTSDSPQNVVELRIDDEIEPILAEYIVNGIDQANRQNASLILITLSTPGGLDTSMRQIIQAILSSKVPVVTYVYPTGSRAASAGFFILLSADIAAMAPGTDTGAASPITAIGGQPVQVDQTLAKKILNEANAYLRSYVSKRGRNADLASTAVTDAKAFTEKEALDGKLIDLIANSPQDLFAKLNGRTITRFDGTTTQLALSHPVDRSHRDEPARKVSLAHRAARCVLHFVDSRRAGTLRGVHPSGIVRARRDWRHRVLLALFAMHLLPVNLAGILLIVLAMALFVLEAKFPTHGVLGCGRRGGHGSGRADADSLAADGKRRELGHGAQRGHPFAVIIVFLMRLVLRSAAWKPSTGKEELIGEEGQVTEPVGSAGSAGMVFVHGELWRAAAANGEAIPEGRPRAREESCRAHALKSSPWRRL